MQPPLANVMFAQFSILHFWIIAKTFFDAVSLNVTFSACTLSRLTIQGGMENEKHPLFQYLKANGESVTDFARRIGFSRMRVYRIVKGENTSTESIKQLVAATNGAVPVTAFIGDLSQTGAA